MSGCSKSKCLIAFIAVFIFMFGFDWVFHGQLLMSMYDETAAVWRPMEEMESFFALCLLYHAVMAAVFTCGYKKFIVYSTSVCSATGEQKPCCPHKRSLCYGLFIGLIMGVGMASWYMHLPVPPALAFGWLAAGILQGLGVGLVLSLVYNNKMCAAK
jgi:uncharacterized membrane-anchored protein YitT (DUF2179 family)